METTITTNGTTHEYHDLEILNERRNRLFEEHCKSIQEPNYPKELLQEWDEKINRRKRLREKDGEQSDETAETKKTRLNDKTWEKYFILEPTEKDPEKLKTLHPFIIEKSLKHIVGEGIDTKKLKSGSWLVEVKNEKQSRKIKQMTHIHDIPIKITTHGTLNSKKGVIRCADLKDMTEDDLLTELQEQGVIEVKRIKFKKNGILQNSNTLILTFGTHTLPETIKAGYLRLQVSQYIPNPLRCYKCQRYGHHKNNCRGNQSCQVCSEEGHDSRDCSNTPKCKNCNGNHPAYSKDCPTWEQEKKIVKTKVENNITFQEARRRCKAGSAAGPVTYAQVVVPAPPPLANKSTTSKKSIDTQTDMTWPINSENYEILTTEIQTQTDVVPSLTEQLGTTEHITETPKKDPKTQPAPAQQTATKKIPQNTIKKIQLKHKPGPQCYKTKKKQEIEIEIHNPFSCLTDEEGEEMEISANPTRSREPSTLEGNH